MAFFQKIMSFFRFIGRLFVPLGGLVTSSPFLRVLGWILHVIIVILFVWLLYWLNNSVFDYPKLLTGYSQFVRKWWLPILFGMVYVLAWLGYWLWLLIFHEIDGPEFPDITEAWEIAMSDLERQNIDIKALPLFLVLGRPDSPMESLFQAAKQKHVVRESPSEAAPLSVFATADAIYVTIVGCSIMGEYCTQLAGASSTSAGPQMYEDPDEYEDASIAVTMGFGGDPEDAEVKNIIDQARREGREISAAEKRVIRRIARQDRTYQSCVRNADEVARLSARLEAFCTLLGRDRWPYCAINGILMLVPLAATDTDQDALDAGSAAKHDLSTIQRVLQVNCAVVGMLSDLEAAPGADEFIRQFSERDRDKRIGQRCPRSPHLAAAPGRSSNEDEARTAMLGSLAEWVGNSVTAGWVYRFFQLDNPAKGDDYKTFVRINSNLFLFLNDMSTRHSQLAKVLSHALVERDREPAFFCGCYISATGNSGENSRAFVKGVFQRNTDEENYLTWTQDALDEEADTERKVTLCQIILAVLTLLTVAVYGYFFFYME